MTTGTTTNSLARDVFAHGRPRRGTGGRIGSAVAGRREIQADPDRRDRRRGTRETYLLQLALQGGASKFPPFATSSRLT
jgi:hypothetical protein